MRPETAHAPLVRRADEWISCRRAILPAHHRAVFDAHLPEGGVAREERGVAAAADEAFDRVAHLPRPVLVVSDAQVEPIGIEDVRPRVEIEAREHVDAMSGRLGPGDEAALPVEPAGGAAPRVDAVAHEVVEPRRHVALAGPGRVRKTIVGLARPGEESLRQRPIERDARRGHVQVRPAPVVVRAPRRRREREHDRRVATRVRRPHDEERVARRDRRIGVGGVKADLVVARAPCGIDGDLERDGPAASSGRGVVGNRVLLDRHAFAPKDDLATGADARDLDRDRPNRRRAVQVHGLAGDDARRCRVSFDDGVDDRIVRGRHGTMRGRSGSGR
jgi:hypothetical protein